MWATSQMNRHQLKGIMISILFIVSVSVLGIDLGRFFWIALVLLIAVTAIVFPVCIAIKAFRRRR
jgi:hypothetical protein